MTKQDVLKDFKISENTKKVRDLFWKASTTVHDLPEGFTLPDPPPDKRRLKGISLDGFSIPDPLPSQPVKEETEEEEGRVKDNYRIKYLLEGFQLPKIKLLEGWVSHWCQNHLTPEQIIEVYNKGPKE